MIKEISSEEPISVDGVLTSINVIKENAIEEFIKKCRSPLVRDGLIYNWAEPCGTTFERMEELKTQIMSKEQKDE